MTRQLRTQLALLLVALTALTGCHPTQPFYLHEDGDLSHFIDHAVSLSNPDVYEQSLDEVTHAQAPFTLSHPGEPIPWDLSLEEAISIAMKNSKVIRNLGGVTQIGFADALVGRTGNASIYDVALSETNASSTRSAVQGTGANATTGSTEGRVTANQAGGVESALAAFDAQLRATNAGTVGNLYAKSDRPGNFMNFPPSINNGDRGGLRFELAKRTASGATASVASITDYENIQQLVGQRAVNSVWTQSLEIEAHQPLLRGAGTQINRIPIVLARINTDISAANFEGSVRNMVLDVENTYWDLYCAYRAVQTAKIGRDSAQVTWNNTNEKKIGGLEDTQHESQAREQYFFFRAALQQAKQQLFEVESRLRFLMGLTATDGRAIRPSDNPTAARIEFDWAAIHTEALVRSPELRSQKWALKQRELELMSAKNQLLPVLDVGAVYRWLGRGDGLVNADRNGIDFPDPGVGSNAVEVLTGGDYQEFGVFINFGMPVGFRREMAGVRNAQLQIARAKAVLEDMELNTSHLLSSAIRNLDFQYELAQSHFNRWQASQEEVEALEALHVGGKDTLDIVLEAQRRRAQGQIDFHRALCDYNKALAEVHFRKASLLEYNNIFLAEGSWPEKAYYDALGHARERDASYYLDYGWTRPGVVSQGPVPQHIGDVDGAMMMPGGQFLPHESVPSEAVPAEQVPAGQPTLADPTMREIIPLSDPERSGPITTRPEGPALNGPRRAEAPGVPAYNWGTLGLNFPGIDANSEPNVLRQATFEQPE